MGRFGQRLLRVCACFMFAVAPALAQDKTPPVDTPSSIPVPEIATRAEEAAALLRSIDTLLASNTQIEEIRRRLPDVIHQVDSRIEETNQQLEARPSIEVLDGLLTSWQRMRGELAKALDTLTQRATRLELELGRLSGVLDTWKKARADARITKVPAPVLERIDSLLAVIPQVQSRLRAERSVILVLQDQVARQLARSEDGLDRVAGYRQGYVGTLLARDTPPIWSGEAQEKAWNDFAESVRESYTASTAHLREFFREESGRLLLMVVLFVGLALLLRRVHRQTYLQHLIDERGSSVELVFARPVATALLICTLIFLWAYPRAPRPVHATVLLIALVAVLRSVAPLVATWQVHWLYGLGAFFVADLLRGLFAVVPQFERQLFLLEMLVGAGAVGWVLYRHRGAQERGQPWNERGRKRVDRAMALLLIGFTIAFLAGTAGYMSLGRQVGYGSLSSAYVALALAAAVRVAYGLVVLLLRVRPLNRLQSIQRHRALLEQRILGLLRALGFVGWAWLTLKAFSLSSPVAATVRGALTANLAWGSLSLSLGDVLAFALTVYLAFQASRLLRFLLEEDVYPRTLLAPGVPYAISSLLHYLVLLLGFLLAMAALGVDFTKLTIIGGALGVGIGFGLQNVVNNFVSGLILLFERPIRIGDAVQIADITGEVRRIGMRSTTVRTWEGAEVIVPNASLVSDKVTNWTPSDRMRRIDLAVAVAYASVPEKVLEVLRTTAGAHAAILSEPPPLALFVGFGENALLFELRTWTGRIGEWLQIRSELALRLHRTLGEAGIQIALPRREVVLRADSAGTHAASQPRRTLDPLGPEELPVR
ncbi:MAG TPA: mechanosensitive ion channel domain-containing protein [Candidatus Methylomirabilis sp.]|nr:mechanosensitive ion channel domain-containing protein [Candidatus Methylomirabilis sp.]